MKMDLTGSPLPLTFHLPIRSSWLQTLWTDQNKARNLKSLHLMFTFSVCGRRLLLLCCRQIMILIVMKYEAGCSEHRKHQMKGILLFWALEYLVVFWFSHLLQQFQQPESLVQSQHISWELHHNCSPRPPSTRANGFPRIYTRSVQLDEIQIWTLSGWLHHCLCSGWIPLSREVPATVTTLFILMVNSTKTCF